MYFNIQEQIIISMMLEGHSREGTNASPFVMILHKKISEKKNHNPNHIYIIQLCKQL